MSMAKQCKLLSLHRSGIYYKPRGESELNLKLMRMMDEHYLHHSFKGARSMHTWLTKDKGLQVSKNRVERLYYRVMGLRATQPGKHTSRRHKAHKVYPYLLRNLTVKRPNQVWAIDITYIPMKKGFMYLIAIIDLYSRYVVNWSVSNSMDADWCLNCLEEAIETHGKPEILNTDQGSQFTSEVFANFVLSQDIKLSMDGKGRAIDNAFIERLWRSVKYEKLYLNPPKDGMDLYLLVAEYFNYYNMERRHTSIENQRPIDLYQTTQKQAA
ncbi:IS3 family transposase [Reichenbachiella ulvae]|uniref:IS3 family transposase n=1 Tax=Reichenbachiella ulvae TaxID=2980104 RepID=A0ABT3CW19_9BACT|nr:IS3 family transposase [Reichenbachiella ulvae]MCV9385290.1 IS3 family transposase [Reichenbachiella ulvae]MCV9385529.1 IS3 family transposase [Reichenbachiella ulvae]MCV9386968.1 IS3 family transposase [Reichenbachiella ulvae]MCV9387888.1 IS3 family transposase [Reichenbachiella ulvae]MCV9389162.1 IS3 family transposase [Reichenbachiella ulvae]